MFLVSHHRLTPSEDPNLNVGIKHDADRPQIDYEHMLRALLDISVAIGIGLALHVGIAKLGLELPLFVPCLFAGILVTNIGPLVLPKLEWPDRNPSLALVSDLSLGLFLAMSLMSLQLWTLAGVGLPLLALLGAQVLVVTVFVIFAVFRLMGADYGAAVMSSGYAGLALGATPTAIANMTAVTEKFGASPRAFVVVPLVGAFFIDIANAMIIEFVLGRL